MLPAPYRVWASKAVVSLRCAHTRETRREASPCPIFTRQSTLGCLGDIRGRPDEQDLEQIRQDTIQVLARIQ